VSTTGFGIKPVLVNRYEIATDRLLTSAAEDYGDRLLAKVRVADVLDVEKATGRALSYALAAHFDFVMVDRETSVPRFAVELDGRQHLSDPVTKARDRLKDDLCARARFPLLRVTSDFTRREGRWIVLSYLVEAFYRAETFFDAQEQGIVPMDEIFDAGMVLTRDEDGRPMFDTLDAVARRRLWEHKESGRLSAWLPDVFVTRSGEQRTVHAHAFMAVAVNRYLICRVRVRDFLFRGISASDVAEQLAVADLADQADRWLAQEPVACDLRELTKAMTEVQQAIDAGGFLGSFNSGALRAGGPLPPGVGINVSF
jgi:hypothetical protein